MRFCFLNIILVSLIPLIGLAKKNENTSNRIVVVVNKYLSAEIIDSLNIYFEDLKNEGYNPILKEWSLEDNPNPIELKTYLKNLYEEPKSLQGAVFIGDLPIAIFEATEAIIQENQYQGPFPTDHYYMDLKSNEWKDTDGNGSMDKPMFNKDNVNKRAIWVSRLNSYRKTGEPSIIRNYFIKNHKFRTGIKLYEERSWNYIFSEELLYIYKKSSIKNVLNPYITLNKATDFFLGDISKTMFLKLLTENSNEMGMWIFHGSTTNIWINHENERISSNELRFKNIETAFLLPISCWIGDYTAFNYFSGNLLFSESSNVQALISNTTPTRTWSRNFFAYPFQEGKNFGESYLIYLATENLWPQEMLNDERSRVILGDGTLKRQRYLIAPDNMEHEENILRSPMLRKEITPASILPEINTLRFDPIAHKILWDKYYNEDHLTYRLVKKVNGQEIIIYEGKDNNATDYNLQKDDIYLLTYIWNDSEISIFTSKTQEVEYIYDDEAMDYAESLGDTKLEEYLLKIRSNENSKH